MRSELTPLVMHVSNWRVRVRGIAAIVRNVADVVVAYSRSCRGSF